MKLEQAIARVEERQCSFDEYRGGWVKHRIISGGCATCDIGLWSLMHRYGIDPTDVIDRADV